MKIYSQRPLSPSKGYRPRQLLDFRIAGVGEAVAAPKLTAPPSQLTIKTARSVPTQKVVQLAGRPVSSGLRPMPHPDTPAYEFGGGMPTLFDNWTGWTSTLSPLIRPEWFWLTSPGVPISQRPREGGLIGPVKKRYATYRNTPFFAAEFVPRDSVKHYSTWPNRRQINAPGNAPDTHFRVNLRTRDDEHEVPMWPHVPAATYGDVPVVISRFARTLPRVLPSGRYIQARERRYPRTVIPTPRLQHPDAIAYKRDLKPGMSQPTEGEKWIGVSGMQYGAIGALGESSGEKINWANIAMLLLAIPGAILAWDTLKKRRT